MMKILLPSSVLLILITSTSAQNDGRSFPMRECFNGDEITENYESYESEYFDDSPDKKIPEDIIRKLSEEINYVDALRNMTYKPDDDISSRMELGGIERNAVVKLKRALCEPELTTVPILLSDSELYDPTCVRVERCGGCCFPIWLKSCTPVDSEVIHIRVSVYEYRGNNQLQSKERLYPVERHKKCKCGCKILQEDCSPFQTYDKNTCSCRCINTDKEKKCKQDQRNKRWNNDICQCFCKQRVECGSGYKFDDFSCKCEPVQRISQERTPWIS